MESEYSFSLSSLLAKALQHTRFNKNNEFICVMSKYKQTNNGSRSSEVSQMSRNLSQRIYIPDSYWLVQVDS